MLAIRRALIQQNWRMFVWMRRLSRAGLTIHLVNTTRLYGTDRETHGRMEYWKHYDSKQGRTVRKPIITVYRELEVKYRIWVLIHEVAHQLLLAPLPDTEISAQSRNYQEFQADYIAFEVLKRLAPECTEGMTYRVFARHRLIIQNEGLERFQQAVRECEPVIGWIIRVLRGEKVKKLVY